MNPQIHSEEPLITITNAETATTDADMLDRTEVIRHLEFLKLLVLNGKMEP